MKLHSLELEGFGPFLHRQCVDFDAFDGDGIFLISGRTGAGKSSILDGVCFALYGSVPRYDSGDKRIRSDHAAPEDATTAVLEFTVDGARYRVTRSPDYERPKARGVGTTPVKHAAQLDERVGDAWIGRAAGPRDVGLLLDEILGLSRDQFLQVILLAQNRFAQFLLAKNDDRQAVLRTLFGTRVYEDYQAALEQRRKQSEHDLGRAGDQVELLLAEAAALAAEHGFGADDDASAATAARLALAVAAVDRAAYRADTLARERDAADEAVAQIVAAHTALVALDAQRRERDAARLDLAAREAAEPAFAADRATLGRATRAEALRSVIAAAARAAVAVDDAAAAESAALAAWSTNVGRDAEQQASVDITALRRRIDEMTGDLSRWADAAALEAELQALDTRIAADRVALADLDAQLVALDAARAGAPAQLATLDEAIAGLEGAAVVLTTARTALAATETQLAAAREAAARADDLRTAEQAHAAALTALESAAGALTSLLRRRLEGFAGELAGELVDGDPCAVCGSREHPAPAVHDGEPVTDEMLAAAERTKDDAAAAEQSAATAARAARAAHSESAARAHGRSADDLEAALAAARTAVDAAAADAARQSELIAQRAELSDLDALAAAERDALAVASTERRQRLAVADERATTMRATVTAARGAAPRVANRIAETTRLRDLTRALADAADAAAARRVAHAEALVDRDAEVAASDFSDVDDAVAALRDDATRSALTRGILDHEVALRTVRERLRTLELDLAGRDSDDVDLEQSARAVAAAKDAARAATQAAERVAQAAARLRSLTERADAAYAGIAGLASAHELIAGLAAAVAGRTASRMDLETFVLAAELEEIVAQANVRLDDMSSGRYRLRHSDAVAARNAASGLGIEIIDAYTGRARPAQSLSGGETFLASLALALGLAEVVTARAGGLRLDTLFIDEGFGSLDAETLELAMRTLDELRQGGRTVGVISHVEAMKEQLPAQLTVTASPHGPSTITQHASVAV
ncbi:AAA family ATPase [Microbacterium terricola]|uniref:Nuclease SbcCD subunit C n=1 Tax=Microbacterium terricola TaxID=344163 RepID=A0ABM8E1L9_9MICO|nr:AAA family ATPase [Microbacterium terricola]UYK40564.1 AAA family ATPase [Microbacterium terricola]BDV31709.1 hypothetical protein Microterr_23690 [Microbacterium terricola]